MIITFIGHGTLPISESQRNKIKTEILNYAHLNDVVFYCGGHGDFDNVCASICREIKGTIPNIEIVYVSPYLTSSQQEKMKFLLDSKLYDSTIYPPIENVPPRYAITKRNEWMVDQADVIIAYVSHEYGGAYKTLTYAKRKNKTIINLHNK